MVVPELAQDPNLQGYWGWKTSRDNFEDDAVYYGMLPTQVWTWLPLEDPDTGETLDMAFVITPEPATLGLLLLGGLAMLRRRQ